MSSLLLMTLICITETRGFVGVVAPLRAKDVAPDIAAIVETIHVRAGDRVKAGDRIATLDARSLNESLAGLNAELRSAIAARAQAKVELEEAQRKLELEGRLASQDLATKQAAEDAGFAHKRAVAALARASSQVEERRAQLERARRQVKEATVRAPFAGTIAARIAAEGMMVGPEAPVVRLIERDVLWVKFAVPAAEANALALGTPMVVELETTGEKLQAIVKQIAPELDPASHMIFAEAELSVSPAERELIPSGVGAWVKPQR